MNELGFIERICEKELFGKDSPLDGEAKWLFKTKYLNLLYSQVKLVKILLQPLNSCQTY